jgi:hypothetical protein
MNRTRIIALFCFALFLVGSAFIYLTRIADYPNAQAKLSVRSGRAEITRATGQPDKVEAGGEALANAGDTIQMDDGDGTLNFAGTQVGLEPGTTVQIDHYGASGSEAQIDLSLKAGQVSQRVIGFTDRRSLYRLTSANGTVETKGGELLVGLDDNQELQIGVIAGAATASGQGHTVALAADHGTVIVPGKSPANAALWSRVIVETYRPDASPVILPVMLVNSRTGDSFRLHSHQISIVPDGVYRLTIDLLKPYEVNDLQLAPGVLNEAPITLSEIVFAITSVDGKPMAYTALNVQGSQTVRALPDTPVLISPGKWTVIAAREEKPDKIQPVDLTLLPGQRLTVPLRNDLFGGGAVQVHVTAPDGTTAAPVNVAVYPAGTESNPPLVTFRSDGDPQPLPEGAYAISVRTPIAARYEVNVTQGQTATLQTRLGSITVNYMDALGRAVQGNVVVYIASAVEMQRLALTIDQMRQTPYGVAVKVATPVTVPTGVYNILVNDQKGVGQQDIHVDPGQAVSVNLKASP